MEEVGKVKAKASPMPIYLYIYPRTDAHASASTLASDSDAQSPKSNPCSVPPTDRTSTTTPSSVTDAFG